jgi:hypothetical protein
LTAKTLSKQHGMGTPGPSMRCYHLSSPCSEVPSRAMVRPSMGTAIRPCPLDRNHPPPPTACGPPLVTDHHAGGRPSRDGPGRNVDTRLPLEVGVPIFPLGYIYIYITITSGGLAYQLPPSRGRHDKVVSHCTIQQVMRPRNGGVAWMMIVIHARGKKKAKKK